MRYWKVIFISIMIVVGIGAHYVQSALAKSEFPEFVIETVNGDEKALEGITITGQYGAVNPNQPLTKVKAGTLEELYEHLEITKEGTVYQEEKSYLDQMSGMNRNATIERLQEEYRNFMRGKGGSTSTFFENDKVLAYAGPFGFDPDHNGKLEIELLDKETNDKMTFQVKISETEVYNLINILDVQMVQDELVVMARSYGHGNPGEKEEVHVYRIDVETQELISDEVILSTEGGTNTEWTHIGEVSGSYGIGTVNYFVFNVAQMKGHRFHSATSEESKYVAYQYNTNEIVEITDLPDEVDGENVRNYVKGDSIYFIDTSDNNLKVNAYSIPNKEFSTFDIQTTKNKMYQNNVIEMTNDKLYLVNSDQKQAMVYVVDLSTENLLYEGNITFQHEKEQTDDYYLDIFDIKIK
ncbi:hypothetical protein [Oceanobacillus senegalensis]|uniref:hypothetical protein n=1 Tax=Oceanobacillus senegalensis TaxID=1936063 RepID=UPI000A313F0E|nr:hypothetical protein [Oceanobacillus senegalensis]